MGGLGLDCTEGKDAEAWPVRVYAFQGNSSDETGGVEIAARSVAG